MIDLGSIALASDLIDEGLKSQIVGVLAKINKEITIKAVIDMEDENNMKMAEFLNVFASLCDKIKLELYMVNEAELVSELDITYLPVTGLYKDGVYGRACFHGIPGGKEINSFIVAILNLAGAKNALESDIQNRIEKLNHVDNIKICVSLACHHCPGVVAACQQIAMQNSKIEAEMIDANLYPSLIEQYKIERVPMIIVNNENIFMGNKTMEDIVELLENSCN